MKKNEEKHRLHSQELDPVLIFEQVVSVI